MGISQHEASGSVFWCVLHLSLDEEMRWVSYANNFHDSKVHGAKVGPTWGRQDPSGPHAGHMNVIIWVVYPMRPSYGIMIWYILANIRSRNEWCLTLPSQYRNHCSPVTSEALRRSPEGNFRINADDWKMTYWKLQLYLLEFNEFKVIS